MSKASTAPQTARTGRRRLRMIGYFLLALVAAIGLLWLFGPREPVVTQLRFDPSTIGNDVDAYLAQKEARFDDIKPEQHKQISWAFPQSRAQTPVSLVYLHGFSASRLETHPMTDTIARSLGANVFYSRLSGHGRSNDAMAEPTVQDWMDDAAEAIEIGKRIGARTVLVSVSTGGTLAAVAAMHPDLRDQIDAIIFVSPNFKVKAVAGPILTAPFARSYITLLAGETRGFEPANDMHATWWTTSYPTVATLPMAAIVRHSRSLLYERTDIPALFVFSDNDSVVDAQTTRAIAERWGGPKEMIIVNDSDDPSNHVLAGDALSPSTTERLAAQLSTWIDQTLDLAR